DSITATVSEAKDVFRYTIGLSTSKEQVDKVITRLERLCYVLKACVHKESEVVHQEVASYKIKTGVLTKGDVDKGIRRHHARILTVDPNFMVIEKTRNVEETQLLFEKLSPYGVLEFVRSGRVAVTKPMKEFSAYLEEI